MNGKRINAVSVCDDNIKESKKKDQIKFMEMNLTNCEM